MRNLSGVLLEVAFAIYAMLASRMGNLCVYLVAVTSSVDEHLINREGK